MIDAFSTRIFSGIVSGSVPRCLFNTSNDCPAERSAQPKFARFGLIALFSLLVACCGEARSIDPASFDPLTIERTGRPNDYLVCADHHCSAPSDRIAPVLAGDFADLRQRWLQAIGDEPLMIVTKQDGSLILAEQRSRIFGFVDDLAVHLIVLEQGISFAVYSRSRFGHYDFGVNKARVERLIANIAGVTDPQ